eukprot:gene19085-21001_t
MADCKLLLKFSRRNIVVLCCFLAILCRSSCANDDKGFQTEVLDQHNKHRSVHNAGPLKLDEKLSKNATAVAEMAAKNEDFDDIAPGESVFVSCATFKRAVSGKEVTDAWYGEVCAPDFDFASPDNEKTRGFTQMVWKDTNRIGVGRATGTNKNKEICTYIVGVYRPPGNLVGFFQENVEEGSFDKDETCSGVEGEGADTSYSREANFKEEVPDADEKNPDADEESEDEGMQQRKGR